MSDKIKHQPERFRGKICALILLRSSKSCINSSRFKLKPATNV